MRTFFQKIFLLFFLAASYCAQAQVKFSASITPSEIGKDEYAQLKLMVENANDIQQIVPPDLKNFIIISGPNQESGMTMVNGVVKKYFALNFVIKPKSPGNFTIPSALAKVDAGDYKSNPVTLRVTTKPSGNNSGARSFSSPFSSMDPFTEPAPRASYSDFILRKGENAVDKIKKNMFIKAAVDKKSCYVGEPVVVVYKLYTRLKSESNMIKNPSFNGFSVLDLQQPNDLGYQTEKFAGREYHVYIIRKVQLYPLLPGNLELGIVEIENEVHFIKAEYINQQPDIMNDFTEELIPAEGIENRKITLQSKPLQLLVKPLPDINKPTYFKGAVGDFSIEAKLEKKNFSTDDAGRLAIIISGAGNLQLINAPEINWPAGMEAFDSKATDDLYKGTVPVSGRKIFEFPFIVSKAGTYSLPAVSFSFFDTRAAKYKTISTTAIEFTVNKGTAKPKKNMADTDSKTHANYLTQFFSNRLRVVSLFAVLIILGLIIWAKKDAKNEKKLMDSVQLKQVSSADEKSVPESSLSIKAPLVLAEAYLQQEDSSLFYTQLNTDIKNYLSKKLSILPDQLNKKNMTEQLDANAVPNSISLQLQDLIDDIEWQLYTPSVDHSRMKAMYVKANDLIKLLEACTG